MLGGRTLISLLLSIAAAPCVWPKDAAQLGRQAFQKGLFNEAAEAYGEALQAGPTFAVHVNLGHCYMRMGRWSEAAKNYEAAVTLSEESATGDTWRFLGRARYQDGQIEKALEAFRKADWADPNPAEQDTLWIARCLMELRQWTAAKAALYEHLRRDSHGTDALELLGQVQDRMNDWAGVTETYTQLLARAPERASYRIALANALALSGRNRQAIDVLEFAWRIDLSSAKTTNRLLADLYLAEAMPREAAVCYARALLETDRPAIDDYWRLGMAYFQGREWNSAKQAFQEIEQSDPNDTRANLFLGHVAMEQDRPREAQSRYKTALAKDPASTETMLALAHLYMKQEQYTQAAAHFAQALESGARGVAVHYNYLLALMHTPDDEFRTEEAFQAALTQHPTDEQILTLLDRFASRVAAMLMVPD